MQVIALLRGVTPTGKNRIPKMAHLGDLLENEGFRQVKTFGQSGNILLETNLAEIETAHKIKAVILEHSGAELAVIIKTKEQLGVAIKENPFDGTYDLSRIQLVFTNNEIDPVKVEKIKAIDFGEEIFDGGSECFYMYLPRTAAKKKLSNNFIEKQLSIVTTTRNLNVVKKLCALNDH